MAAASAQSGMMVRIAGACSVPGLRELFFGTIHSPTFCGQLDFAFFVLFFGFYTPKGVWFDIFSQSWKRNHRKIFIFLDKNTAPSLPRAAFSLREDPQTGAPAAQTGCAALRLGI
jgi:hypothetical protein